MLRVLLLTRQMKIYTKTGDKGTSSLFTGERRPKDDPIFQTLGAVDELTSMLGLARDYVTDLPQLSPLNEQLANVQCRLQDINSNIATPRTGADQHKLSKTAFQDSRVSLLESWIDAMDTELPPLKNFILPSGGKSSSSLHVCRAICRRAERHITPLARDEQCDRACAVYLNRLSDYLFTAARFVAMKEGKEEVIYRK